MPESVTYVIGMTCNLCAEKHTWITVTSKTSSSSPSYRLARDDGDFLESDHARAVRLALEFNRAGSYLRAYGLESMVVAFDSARIPSPETPDATLEQRHF